MADPGEVGVGLLELERERADAARQLFARVFGGAHHHGTFYAAGNAYWVHKYLGKLGASTYDNDLLTRFVFECHAGGWRGHIQPGGPGGLTFAITKRLRIEEAPYNEMTLVHPTIAQAVARFESGGSWREFWRAHLLGRVASDVHRG